MITYIKDKENIIAIILPYDHSEPGLQFITPNEFSQQMANMTHPAGKIIDSHKHYPVSRHIKITQEALFIRKGKLEVDLYTEDQVYISTHILTAGDVILLVSGGHGFKILEEVNMVEIKQGPYVEGEDKIRFKGIRD